MSKGKSASAKAAKMTYVDAMKKIDDIGNKLLNSENKMEMAYTIMDIASDYNKQAEILLTLFGPTTTSFCLLTTLLIE